MSRMKTISSTVLLSFELLSVEEAHILSLAGILTPRYMELSAREQQLLDFAIEEFGGPLTQFLLAGLGEDKVRPTWRFTITYLSNEGIRVKRTVKVISHEPEDGSSRLPRGRDPLVFLALIRMLITAGQRSDYRMRYELEDVLKILGWADNRRNRREIDEAIRRYTQMMYSWKMGRAELARNNLSHYSAMQSLISEYGVRDQEEGRRVTRLFNEVVFNSNFIEALRRRRLCDVNWNTHHQLKAVLTG